MNPSKGFCKPKNEIDHKVFNNNWAPNAINKYSFPGKPSFIIRYREIPINAYKVIQTGPKTQEGGLNEGLIRVVYQVETELEVNIDPIIPANWQTIIEIISLNISFIKILYSIRYINFFSIFYKDELFTINYEPRRYGTFRTSWRK